MGRLTKTGIPDAPMKSMQDMPNLHPSQEGMQGRETWLLYAGRKQQMSYEGAEPDDSQKG